MPEGERPGRSVARGPIVPKRSCSWAFAGGRGSPPREAACQRRQRPGGVRWRRAETSSKVQGVWHSLARAVEQDGQRSPCSAPRPALSKRPSGVGPKPAVVLAVSPSQGRSLGGRPTQRRSRAPTRTRAPRALAARPRLSITSGHTPTAQSNGARGRGSGAKRSRPPTPRAAASSSYP